MSCAVFGNTLTVEAMTACFAGITAEVMFDMNLVRHNSFLAVASLRKVDLQKINLRINLFTKNMHRMICILSMLAETPEAATTQRTVFPVCRAERGITHTKML